MSGRHGLQQMMAQPIESRAWLARENSRVIGFASVHAKDAKNGLITIPICHDVKSETGESLLAAAEEFLRDRGVECAQIAGLTREHGVGFGEPAHMWLLNHGYQTISDHYPEMVLELDLREFVTAPIVQDLRQRNEAEGLVFEFLQEQHVESLKELTRADWMRAGLSTPLADHPGRYPYAVCRDGDVVVGFCGGCHVYHNSKGGGWSFIALRGWTPERDGKYFRRGIGTVLLSMVNEWLRAQGAEYQSLVTGVENPAQRLYRNAGYRYCMVTAPQLRKRLSGS